MLKLWSAVGTRLLDILVAGILHINPVSVATQNCVVVLVGIGLDVFEGLGGVAALLVH